jgi:hypothetical protein
MKSVRHSLFVWGLALVCLAAALRLSRGQTEKVNAATDLDQNLVLEAARQDLVEHRLDELVTGLRYLKIDLESNGKLGAEAQARVATLIGRLQALEEGELATARKSLQSAMKDPIHARALLRTAQLQIDQIRRELGSLLLRAGMSHAAEVFADELHDLGAKQEALAQDATASPEQQQELGATLERLLTEVGSLSDYATEALAAVRVARARKGLQESGVVDVLTAAAKAMEDKNPAAIRANQLKAIEMMRNTEIALRPEAQLQALVRARNEIVDLKARETSVRREAEDLRPEQFAPAAPALARRQQALLAGLAASTVGLGVDDLVTTALATSANAAQRFTEQKRSEASALAGQVEENLGKVVEKLTQKIADMQRLDESYRRLQAATTRAKALQDLQERQAQIIDDTDASTAAKKTVVHLAGPQQSLAAQVTRFVAGLPKDNKTDADWSAGITGPLTTSAEAMARAQAQLQQNSATPAREAQFQALESLNQAVRLADKELAFLEQLWSLTQLASDLAEISRYTNDLEGEQRDVRTAVEKTAGASKSVLDHTGAQEMLAKAGGEVEETAALISEARQVEPLLADASQSMAKAAFALGQDRGSSAIEAQKIAEEKLAATRKIALEMAARAEYLTRWISQMEKSTAAGAEILQRQIILRKKTEAAKPNAVAEFAVEQTMIKEETEIWATMEVCGPAYQKAADEMALAIESLNGVKQDEAVKHQKAAEELLKKALDDMFKWIASFEKMQQQQDPTDLPRVMSVLNRLLLMAMAEGELRDHTKIAVNPEFAGLATTQEDVGKMMDAALEVLQKREIVSELGLKLMEEGRTQMDAAVAALRKADRAAAIKQEIIVETSIRKAIAALMVEAFTPSDDQPEQPDPNAPKPDPDEQEAPPPPPNPKGEWQTFLKAATKGDAVVQGKAGWESLTQRDRAALNENFARELPLEYRDVLKEYYRALAK